MKQNHQLLNSNRYYMMKTKMKLYQSLMLLLEFIKEYRYVFKRNHIVQSILVLKDILQDPKSCLVKEELLKVILSVLKPHVKSINITEQSCCYLCLRKFEVPNTNVVMQQLLLGALKNILITSSDKPISLAALSRLAVGINTGNDFHVPTICRHFIPHIMSHIEQCDNEEDLRLLSICIINIQPLITKDILETFKKKLTLLIRNGVINAKTPRTTVKLLHLLNISIWSQKNGQIIRQLLSLLYPNLSNLNITDLKTISRVFGYHLEPAALISPLCKLMKDLIQSDQTVDVLAAYLPFIEPRWREPTIEICKNLLFTPEKSLTPYPAAEYFQIIRALKISDSKICDAYWANILKSLNTNDEEKTHLRFLRHCHRYMHFNNNLGGTYRFIPLERRLSQLAMELIESDVSGRLPSNFARLAAFVLAYGHTPFGWKKFPNVVLSKIISMSSQFSAIDCFLLSRGIHIALELRFRNTIPSLLGMQLATIDSVLSDCIGRHLESKYLSILDLNTIVRTLGYRKSLKNKTIYQEALGRYNQLDYSELNSRIIREMAYNFNISNCIVPIAMEAMFTYIEKNHRYLIGETVEKVLSCGYNLGYIPQSQAVLNSAAFILKRDFENMSGLSIVQACLALCYYKSMPEDLIEKVFCVKFIQRIEEEIHMCYSKATYPERVLNLIMQLNRTVCLDYPEANVPWFQQNYLEAQLSKKHKTRSKFGDDVKNLLSAVLSDDNFFSCNHITPYGYQIDFVIHFDKNREPIPAPAETTILDRITKFAILLLRLDSFCENDLTALRGPEHLKTKHLEMMGYKVIHINEHDWNTRYMNSPEIKTKYLKYLLQI
nr:FAST kinase domain-containing protein 1, mitochondrial isoform X3 [Bactrocera oleae]